MVTDKENGALSNVYYAYGSLVNAKNPSLKYSINNIKYYINYAANMLILKLQKFFLEIT
jgi:hypothetical protein